jgi:hypothetical protein
MMTLPLPKQRRAALLLRRRTGYIRIGSALVFIAGFAVACTANDPGDQTASSSSSGMVQCDNIPFTQFPDEPCQPCVNQKCCPDLAACDKAGPDCLRCADGRELDSLACREVKTFAEPLQTCAVQKCLNECWSPAFCNPFDRRNAPDGGACVPTEPDGAVIAAECTAPYAAVLRGTIDGKPYDLTSTSAALYGFNQISMPFSTHVGFYGTSGAFTVDLEWVGVCLYGDVAPVPVTGTVKLPDESTERTIQVCSLLWRTTDATTQVGVMRFNLLLDGGQLTGCWQY